MSDLLPAAKEILSQINQGGVMGGVFGRDYCVERLRAAVTQEEAGLYNSVPELIWYTNYKGVYSLRSVIPLAVWYGSTKHHPNKQWFMRAFDTHKQQNRDFAIADIGQAPNDPTS